MTKEEAYRPETLCQTWTELGREAMELGYDLRLDDKEISCTF